MTEKIRSIAEATGCNPRASVYLSKEHGQCIICPLFTPAPGLYFEAESPAVLSFDANSEVLGRATWDALLAFRRFTEISAKTATNWPAFQVSGAKRANEFERSFVKVWVESRPGTLQIEATVRGKSARGLFVGRYLSTAAEFAELGKTLHECRWCAMVLKEKEYRY